MVNKVTFAENLNSMSAISVGPSFPEPVRAGFPAILGEFPYQVSLQAYHDDESWNHCSGSILTNLLILTTASCVVHSSPEESYIEAGLVRTEDLRVDMIRGVLKILTHKEFNVGGRLENDMAILVLTSPLEFYDYVHRINSETYGDGGNSG